MPLRGLAVVLRWVWRFDGCAFEAWLGPLLSAAVLRLAGAFSATEAGRLTEARAGFFVGDGMVGGL